MPKLAEAARAERRKQLIDAAWRCAARKGYHDMTVDDVCIEAGVSKGAFYGYFHQKQDLLVALLEDDADSLNLMAENLDHQAIPGIECLRRYTREVLVRSGDAARVQVRADLWTAVITEKPLRERLAATVQRRRGLLRGWIERAVRNGEMQAIPANAFASILLALTDGLMLHGNLQPSAFKWANIRRALDVLLAGIAIQSPGSAG